MLLVTSSVNEVVVVRLTTGTENADRATSIAQEAGDDDAVSDMAEADRPRKRRKITEEHEVLYLHPWSRDEYLQRKAAGDADIRNDQDEAGPSDSSERIPEMNGNDSTEAPGSRADCW